MGDFLASKIFPEKAKKLNNFRMSKVISGVEMHVMLGRIALPFVSESHVVLREIL